MTVHATAAILALLFTAAPTVLAWAEKAVPFRVAVAVKTDAANAENPQRLLQGMEVGMKWVYGRKLEVVDAASSPDALVDVTYELDLGPALTAGALVVAKIDGREVRVNVPAGKDARSSKASWQAAGSRLGQDVGVVLKSVVKPLPAASIESIVERLSGRDPVKRAQAANQAARLGAEGKAAVPALLAVLADDRPLRQIGGFGIDTTPALQAGKALNALGAHAELLAYFRSEPKRHARANALVAIASGLTKGYRDVILEALADDNEDVRTAAAGLAGHYVGPAAAPKLIDIVEHERSRAMREAARRSLSRLAGKDFELDATAWRQWWAGQAQARVR